MNIINSNNIDKWLFDYFEGNLSLHEKIEVEQFIKENPGFKEDYDSWSNTTLEEPAIMYQHVDSLIKTTSVLYKRYLLGLLLLLTFGGSSYYIVSSTSKSIANNDIHAKNKNDLSVKNKNNSSAINIKTSVLTNTSESNTNGENKSLAYSNIESLSSSKSSTTINYTSGKEIKSKTKYDASISTNYTLSKSNKLKQGEVSQLNSTEETVSSNETIDKTSFKKGFSKGSKANKDNLAGNFVNHNTSISSYSKGKNDKTNWFKLFVFKWQKIDQTENKRKKRSISQKSNTIKEGERDYKRIKAPTNKSIKSKGSLAKSLTKLFNKDIALTVFRNRISLNDNLITINNFDGLAGGLPKPRIQSSYKRGFNGSNSYQADIALDFRINRLGIGVYADYDNIDIANKTVINTIVNYEFGNENISIIPALNIKTGNVFSTMGISNFNDPTNDIDPNVVVNKTGYNANAGVLVELPFAYIGVQGNNLVGIEAKGYQETLFGQKSLDIIAGTDYRKYISTNVLMSPQVYINVADKTTANFVLTGKYKAFILGGAMSTTTNAQLLAGFEAGNFRMIYKANNPLSDFDVNLIQHEVGIQMILTKRKRDNLVY